MKGSQDWAIIDEVNTLGLRGETSINKDYVDKAMDLKVEVTVNAGLWGSAWQPFARAPLLK